MAFKLKQESRHQIIAQERLYLSADRSRVVREGDPAAAFLLAAVGQAIALPIAKQLGLVEDDLKVAPETERRTNRRATPDATR